MDFHSPASPLRPLFLSLGFQDHIGWIGVDIFFVLSGFLVGGLLMKEWKTRGHIDVKRFLIRRGFKIWPQYYLYLAVLLLTQHATPHASLGKPAERSELRRRSRPHLEPCRRGARLPTAISAHGHRGAPPFVSPRPLRFSARRLPARSPAALRSRLYRPPHLPFPRTLDSIASATASCWPSCFTSLPRASPISARLPGFGRRAWFLVF